MADLALTVKREATVQGWRLFIRAATGSDPIISRQADGARISWNAGQATKMADYLAGSTGGPSTPGTVKEGVNVKLDTLPVIIPLFIRKGLLPVAVYTALVVAATLFWKGRHG